VDWNGEGLNSPYGPYFSNTLFIFGTIPFGETISVVRRERSCGDLAIVNKWIWRWELRMWRMWRMEKGDVTRGYDARDRGHAAGLRPISSATLLLSYMDIPKVPSTIPIEKALKSAPSIGSCTF
jgi:hypothetical protein